MSLVVISREMGSGGTQLGRAVAERLGYRFADREVVLEAARRYHVQEDKLARFEETKPSFWERFDTERSTYLAFIEAALYSFAAEDDAVITGRAAPFFFRDVPHAMRVRVIAPLEVRAARVAQEEKISLAEAEARVRRHDEESFARLTQLFQTDCSSPALYDLVMNSERGTLDGAARTLESALRFGPFAPTAESLRQMHDRALAAQVRAELLRTDGLDTLAVQVRADHGTIFLEGAVFGPRWADLATEIARKVAGVQEVVCTRAALAPLPPPPP
ncbi:MAG: hypothetical protein QOD06_334 [Candidatus Binatota bacterium]|jgi:cytidylate kinase|nr:hypothetical protein [Candidatus Binatota bacterium]